MSDLRPTGVTVNFDGKERKLLFSICAIDELESEFEKPVLEILEDMTGKERRKVITETATILLNADVECYNLTHNDQKEKLPATYLGTFLTDGIKGGTLDKMMLKIMEAYELSMPEEKETDPNRKSGQQSD